MKFRFFLIKLKHSMNFLGDKITTATTIAETMSELASTELLEIQASEGKQKLISNYTDVWVCKSNIVRKVNNIQQIYKRKAQVRILPKSHNAKICNRFQKCKIKIIDSLQKLFFKKKRFIFQILKQFFLFPDDSQSSISILSTYDPLIFKDEIIHSLVKKLETKIIQNKIWAFQNLRRGFNKSNIHCHERPKQLNKADNRCQSNEPPAHCSCYWRCAQYCSFCEYGYSCCPYYGTARNQVVSCCYSRHELYSLESRIQYLNFLRKVVKEQQAEQKVK